MRFFACVVGAICKSPYAVACVFSSNSPALQIRPCFQLPPCGRANYNSPLRVCYLNVGKYRCKYTCKYTEKHHGHGMDLFACVVGAKSASWRSGVCDAIRPHFNSPLRVCYLNVGKYHVNTCKYACKYTKNITGMVWICLRVFFSHVDGCVVSFVFRL